MKKARLEFSAPAFEVAAGGRLALDRDWRITYRGEAYAVPRGFVTDGASVPAWLQWLCGSPLEPPRMYAALVHDWLYSGGDPEATRADADDIYRDLQMALGVPRWKAYAEWAALRLFGASHWASDAEAKPLRVVTGCALLAAALFACGGCGKFVDVEGKGMYANANSGVVGIGEFEVVAYPEGVEGARIKYEEDTAWLSPATKTHAIKIDIVGTNACAKVPDVVTAICSAFVAARGTSTNDVAEVNQ